MLNCVDFLLLTTLPLFPSAAHVRRSMHTQRLEHPHHRPHHTAPVQLMDASGRVAASTNAATQPHQTARRY